MKRSPILACVAAAAALAGCVVMPAGPMIPALPGSQKSLDQFRYDDESCRGAARAGVSGATQAAADKTAATAAGATAIGAAAGAIIGAAAGDAGTGAAIGGGSGLLLGGAAADNFAGRSSYELQRAYDMTYLQCMYARGHRVPAGFVQHAPPQRHFAPTYPPRDYPPPASAPAQPAGAPSG